ncbi:MAG: GNAT family N-acetyltransferase/peptidase C39 family protein [Gammaproteobacteria bacterium]|nr:GNAT family N-acetyltransferase/peptidase C39 family protein [Pseudomonadales bacterium]MCP5345301.1 GNAT family N-acetyltransferase/peptidase C39 family protein [Pseudomonadales bacterium]
MTSTVSTPVTESVRVRPAGLDDLERLYALEVATFETDRLSRRRMQYWIRAENGILLLAEQGEKLLGYCLTLLHRGTRLARLYSLAVSPEARGQGIAVELIQRLEKLAVQRGKLFMRLEVAKDNQAAIQLYKKLGFVTFGTFEDYYEDHRDALRMQKRIRHVEANLRRQEVPWYQQTTGFTCGPAALMMVMTALDRSIRPSQELELDIWREATTIYMTTGHGGCHPIGLALAAQSRGFEASVMINNTEPLFVEGVRTTGKKQILTVVHNHFVAQAVQAGVPVTHANITQKQLEQFLDEGALVLMLISTYRMDSRKAPHWVAVTAIDDQCLYVHDPDPTEDEQSALDCQYLPILRRDFDRMSVFGRNQLRTAVIVRKQSA